MTWVPEIGQVTRSDHNEEQALRAAVAAGEESAWSCAVWYLLQRPGRGRDAAEAYRAALAEYHTAAAEAHECAWLILAVALASTLVDPDEDAEAGGRADAAAGGVPGVEEAPLLLGALLSDQPGRENEAEDAFRTAT